MTTNKKSILLPLIFEGITLLCRYGFRLESTRDTASTVGKLTFGLRIHHGYIGLLILFIFYKWLKDKPGWVQWLAPLGFALIFSDLIHHFLVLWPIEGDPHFDFVYPE